MSELRSRESYRPPALRVARRIIAVFGCLLLTPGLASGEQLEATLSRVLAGRTARAKIDFGQPRTYYETSVKRQVTRMVCTDLDVASGQLTYVMPWIALPLLFKEAVDRSALTNVAGRGSVLQLESVKITKERVEIVLLESSSRQPSLLRLWFSKKFESTTGAREVIELIGSLLEFDGTLGEALAETTSTGRFAAQAAEAEGAYQQAAATDSERLRHGIAYLNLLEGELEQRRLWAEVLEQPADVADLEQTLLPLEQDIVRLVEQVHGPRLDELRAALREVESQIASVRQSMAESGASEEALAEWRERLEGWRSLVDEYAGLRGGGWETELDSLKQGAAELEQAERTFVLEAEAAAALATKTEHAKFGDAPAASVDELVRQEESLVRSRELLAERRALVSRLGSPAPTDVTTRLEADEANAEKLAELVTQGKERLGPELLEEEYKMLQATQSRLYDQYTMAFGGPRHRETGGQLIEHLDRMIENRREAARLGSSSANSQIDQLRSSIRKIQSQLQ